MIRLLAYWRFLLDRSVLARRVRLRVAQEEHLARLRARVREMNEMDKLW